MRPSAAAPTGTEIGAPVSMTSMPRTTRVGGAHRDRAHLVAADVLLHLDRHADVLARVRRRVDLERVVELGQVPRLELDVEHRADDLDDLADVACVAIAVAMDLSLESRSAADDLGDLLRDLRLTGAVVGAPKDVEDVAGVVRRVLHRGAARDCSPATVSTSARYTALRTYDGSSSVRIASAIGNSR